MDYLRLNSVPFVNELFHWLKNPPQVEDPQCKSEAGFSVSEKVHTQMELSSVSGNPFPSSHELLVFQLKFRNRLSGTEDWKWTSGGILQMGLRSLNLDFQIKNLSVSKHKKLIFSQKYSVLLVVLSLEPTIKIIWIL